MTNEPHSPKSRMLSPEKRIEQIEQTIARLPADKQQSALVEACALFESPANKQPLPHRIESIQLLVSFSDKGSPVEKRLAGIWGKANLDYASWGDGAKQAVRTDMNKEIREKNSRFGEEAARVYCILTYGHPRDLWARVKASLGRRPGVTLARPSENL